MKSFKKRKKFIQTEAIVLKSFDFGDADRIFTILTSNNGIIRVVAKGVRKPKSRMGGHLDILSKVNAYISCLLYTSPSPRDAHESRMPSSA